AGFETRRQVYLEPLRYMHYAMLRTDRSSLTQFLKRSVAGASTRLDLWFPCRDRDCRGIHVEGQRISRPRDDARKWPTGRMNSKESTREMIAYRQHASDLLKKVETLMSEELENL